MIHYVCETGGSQAYLRIYTESDKNQPLYYFRESELFLFNGTLKDFDILPKDSFDMPLTIAEAIRQISAGRTVLGWDAYHYNRPYCGLLTKDLFLLRRVPLVLIYSRDHCIPETKIPGASDYIVQITDRFYIIRSGVSIYPSIREEDSFACQELPDYLDESCEIRVLAKNQFKELLSLKYRKNL